MNAEVFVVGEQEWRWPRSPVRYEITIDAYPKGETPRDEEPGHGVAGSWYKAGAFQTLEEAARAAVSIEQKNEDAYISTQALWPCGGVPDV